MKVYIEQDACGMANSFNFWAGAVQTVTDMPYEHVVFVFEILEDIAPEGMSGTEVNDFFWFENETIAEWLGFESWEEYQDSL